jgi:mutator protein MutT
MDPSACFRHCPRCGTVRSEPAGRPFQCPACDFVLYFNPAVATAAIVVNPEEEVLLIRRARDPARGKLSFPGGFVDQGESAEEGLRRELREEVGLEAGSLRYLCSHVNEYHYKEVTYPVLDFFFVTRSNGTTGEAQASEVESICWLPIKAVRPEEFAFPSLRAAWAKFLNEPPAG